MRHQDQQDQLYRIISIYRGKSLSQRKRLAQAFIKGYFMLWKPEDVQLIIEDICKMAYANASKEEISTLENRAGLNFCLFLQTLLEAVGFANEALSSCEDRDSAPEPDSTSCTLNTNVMSSANTVQGSTTGFQQELEVPGPDHPDYPYYLLARYFTEQTYEQAYEKLYQLLDRAVQNNLETTSIEQLAEMRSFFNGFAQLLYAANKIYAECIEVEETEDGTDNRSDLADHTAASTSIPAPGAGGTPLSCQIPDTLQQVITLIKNTVHPEKVFLVNSEGKDAGSYYDMLVLVSKKYKQPLSYYQYLIEKACEDRIPGIEVAVTVHKTEDIYPLLQKGHIFYSVACSAQHLVYDNGQLPLPKLSIIPVDEIVSKVNDAFAYGMDKAAAFLDGARHFMFHSGKNIAPQMLFQAAELTLQTVCNTLIGLSLRTNNLCRLLHASRRCSVSFAEVFRLDNKADIAMLQQLQRSHPQSRYHAGMDLNIENLQHIANRIEELQEHAEKVRLERIASFKMCIADWPAEIITPTPPKN